MNLSNSPSGKWGGGGMDHNHHLFAPRLCPAENFIGNVTVFWCPSWHLCLSLYLIGKRDVRFIGIPISQVLTLGASEEACSKWHGSMWQKNHGHGGCTSFKDWTGPSYDGYQIVYNKVPGFNDGVSVSAGIKTRVSGWRQGNDCSFSIICLITYVIFIM